MNEFYDSETFGEFVEPKPSDESKGRPSITASTICSELHSTFSHPKIVGNRKQQHWENDSKKMKIGKEAKSVNTITDNISLDEILKEVLLKPISKTDSFYCSCNESDEGKKICLICGGSGEVKGAHNMIKFVEYLMEFKLKLKGCFVPKTKKEGESSASFFENNASKLNCEQSKIKLKSNNLFLNRAKVNSFCTDFFKNTQKLEQQQNNNNSDNFQGISLTGSEPCPKKVLFANELTEAKNDSPEVSMSQIKLGLDCLVESEENLNLYECESSVESEKKEEKENFKLEKAKDQEERSFQRKNQRMSLNEVRINQPYHNDFTEINSKSMIVGEAKKKPAFRKSVGEQSIISLKEFKEQMKSECSVHCGFSCDSCEMTPIVGPRFHCENEDCGNDYDLCEKCYRENGHEHSMCEIKFNKLDKVLNKISNISKPNCYPKKIGNLKSLNSKILSVDKNDDEIEEERYIAVFKSSIH